MYQKAAKKVGGTRRTSAPTLNDFGEHFGMAPHDGASATPGVESKGDNGKAKDERWV